MLTLLQVSSMKIPSPVKVVREEDRDWRRFSNNFADALPSSVPPVVCSSSGTKLILKAIYASAAIVNFILVLTS